MILCSSKNAFKSLFQHLTSRRKAGFSYMTKFFVFENSFTLDVVHPFLNDVFDHISLSEDNRAKVWISSPGGYNSALAFLFTAMKEYKNQISLVFYDEAHSAAFLLLIGAHCQVEVLSDVVAGIHISDQRLAVNQLNVPHSKTKLEKETLQINNEMFEKLIGPFLTNQELKIVFEDKGTVYIGKDRICTIRESFGHYNNKIEKLVL